MASLHALLIGVPLYDDSGIKDLPFIENDLAELKYALNLKGYQCQVNRFDRTDRDSLDQAIERFLRFAERGSNILVFLSGHGVHYRGADYLVASTAMTHTSNFPSRCLKIDFNGYVEDSTAANVIIAIDACREGIDLRSKSGFNVDGWSTPKRLMVRSRQLAYVYACSAGERAHYTGRQGREFSAFTRAFSEVVGELSGEPYTVIELQSSIQEKLDQISGKHQLPKQSVRVVSEARVDPLNLIGTQRVVTRKHARWSQVLRVFVTSRLALAAVVLALALLAWLLFPVTEETPDSRLVYVANYASNTITKIDVATNTTSTIRSDLGPNRLAIMRNGRRVFVANSNSNTIEAIDTKTDATRRIAVGNKPDDVVVSPDGNRVYVTNNASDSISIIDTVTSDVATVGVGRLPYDLILGHNSRYAYVTNNQSNSISVVDILGKNVVAEIPVGDGPYGLAVTPNGREIYVANNRENSISIIDTATNTVSATVLLSARPIRVEISSDGRFAYVVVPSAGLVSMIDVATRFTKPIAVGENPQNILITRDNSRVYVGNYKSGTVSEIDTTTNTVRAVPSGPTPLGMALAPDESQLYVTNDLLGAVTSLPIPFP
jgi:YVTN family beta-propeller protein